jgi:DNA-3-methyladenine glycosylase
MFGPTGVAYIYMIYGIHHCLNVVAHEAGAAGAILVRGVSPLCELEPTDGPGKLAKALSVDRALNGADLVAGRELWLEDDGERPVSIAMSERIGVHYAGEWARKPWRLFVEGDPHVSGPRRAQRA